MNESYWSRQNHIQKPSTMQLIQTLYSQFNDDFHYTPYSIVCRQLHLSFCWWQFWLYWAIRFQSQLIEHSTVHKPISIQISGFSFNTHKSNPNSEFHSHSLPLTHYSSTNKDITRSASTIQSIHLIVFIQSLPIYRMIKNITFLFWTLNQTRFYQFGSFISHKCLMFILNIDHTKDWNMLAKPIWVVMKDEIESIDDWILINGWKMM